MGRRRNTYFMDLQQLSDFIPLMERTCKYSKIMLTTEHTRCLRALQKWSQVQKLGLYIAFLFVQLLGERDSKTSPIPFLF